MSIMMFWLLDIKRVLGPFSNFPQSTLFHGSFHVLSICTYLYAYFTYRVLVVNIILVLSSARVGEIYCILIFSRYMNINIAAFRLHLKKPPSTYTNLGLLFRCSIQICFRKSQIRDRPRKGNWIHRIILCSKVSYFRVFQHGRTEPRS